MRIGGLPISQQFSVGRIKNEQGYQFLSGDTDYVATRYAGSTSGGTTGGGVGGATGAAGDIDSRPNTQIE